MRFLILFLFLLPIRAFSDEAQIPFSAWPVEIQAGFLEHGKKLDLNANERTDDSFGYLFSKGDEYIIYTYRSVTPEDFEVMKKVAFEVEMAKEK